MNWKLWWYSPQNSTYDFEAVWGQYVFKSLWLLQSHSKITIQLHFSPWDYEAMDSVFFNMQGFHKKKFLLSDFLIFDTKFHYKMCLKYQKQSQTLCSTISRSFWASDIIYFCYSCYFCYEGSVMKFMLFFLVYCYKMKFPHIRKINLP